MSAIKPGDAVVNQKSSSALERDARDLALASTVRTWEGDVGDLQDMSRVFLTVLENTLSTSRVPDQEDAYYLTPDQIGQIFFCAYQSHRMAEAFYETYYAALKA